MLYWLQECICSGATAQEHLQCWPTYRMSRWRHQMDPFSALLALCVGNSTVTSEFPSERPALMFSLFCAWLHGWVNNREAGGLRRYRTHYDAIVMVSRNFQLFCDQGPWKYFYQIQICNTVKSVSIKNLVKLIPHICQACFSYEFVSSIEFRTIWCW